MLLTRAIPDLRIDGAPSLDTIERHLVEVAIERACKSNFDQVRRVIELPTIPDPLSPEWRAEVAPVPVLAAYTSRRSPTGNRGAR